ncbi:MULTISPECIES: pentapeptide repeat-containing protein [Cyanophyceae]|uniref:pentapeptide repeat-containing protein n=1 Tax=Cyanophyceae TaxID=3028117 RepID=UPI001685902F|nr:pentapeptide repeat-containing protein [Trichocoleus sp. FACHB-40]MBD2006301.1 pentapeptide repeat-containing protein [Trichocoleus sp. FACHB-40]
MAKHYVGRDLRNQSFAGCNLAGADFRGANLEGVDFTSANLRGAKFSSTKEWKTNATGANFSYADIRGADFTNAMLRGANFTGVNAGIILYKAICTIGCCLFLAGLATLLHPSFLGLLIVTIFFSAVIMLKIFLQERFTEPQFQEFAIYNVLGCFRAEDWQKDYKQWRLQRHYINLLSTLLHTSVYFLKLEIAIVFIGTILKFSNLQIENYSKDIENYARDMPSQLDLLKHLILTLPSAFLLANVFDSSSKNSVEAFFGAVSFQGANLTDCNFTRAILIKPNLLESNCTRVYWYRVKNFGFNFIPDKYVLNKVILKMKLLIEGEGSNKNFDFMDLEAVNLREANLVDASFVGTDLSRSNLQNANLSGAVLRQTQLDGADLTGAILTGAYIEDWGITGTTKLDRVQCEYVYMRVPTKKNPHPLRKPDNLCETFLDGEFADFIRPYLDTLDLYHTQGVDPRAISIAFKNLAQNHPDAHLEIVTVEKRGHNSLNLKVQTAPEADKSDLSREYFADYNRLKALPAGVQLLLAEKDVQIRSLQQMIQTTLKQPTFSIQGEFMPENSGINISADGNIGDISGLVGGDVSGVVNLGTISGDVTNAVNQLPDVSESDQPNLKELLTQLQQAIENDTNLPDTDKADLLEQVQVLAEAQQTKETTKKEGLIRKANKIFDATLKSLPNTAVIVESCSKLLPMILKALGISA